MNDIFLLKIVAFAAGVSLMTGFGQLFIINKRLENYNLACLFSSMGLLLFQLVLLLNGYAATHKFLTLYHGTLLFCIGPFLFLAYYTVVDPSKKFPEHAYILFIPSIIIFIWETLNLLFWNDSQRYLLVILSDGAMVWNSIIMFWILVVACISNIAYHIYLLIGLLPLWDLKSQNRILNITVIVSLCSMTGLISLCTGYVTGNYKILLYTALYISVCLAGVYFIGQRYPRFLQLLKAEVTERRYKKYLLSKHDVNSIQLHLVDLMEKKNLYKDENLSLKILAECLNITSHQLSQLLNDKLQTNFHNFVNRYRIREAEKILLENPQRPILGIAYDVGFNTKSSFYDAFSRFTGKTPQRYRAEMKNKNPSK